MVNLRGNGEFKLAMYQSMHVILYVSVALLLNYCCKGNTLIQRKITLHFTHGVFSISITRDIYKM